MNSILIANIKKASLLGLVWLPFICLTACQQDDSTEMEPPSNTPAPRRRILITQEQLDSAVVVPSSSDTSFTGNPFLQREPSEQNNVRSIFANISKTAAIRPSAVYVIRNFTNESGQRGQLLFIDVMVKREPGFNSNSLDFEFMRIRFDSSNDYTLHPNGILPDTTQTLLRGLDLPVSGTTCATCHRLATTDLLFHR